MATNYVPATINKQVASNWKNTLNRLNGGSSNTKFPTRARINGANGFDYNGYFKIIISDTSKIQIVNGHNYDDTACGFALINQSMFPIAKTELTITADAYIYFEVEATWNGSTWVVGTPSFQQSVSIFAYEANKFKTLIGNVFYADGIFTYSPVQQQYGMIIGETAGDCT